LSDTCSGCRYYRRTDDGSYYSRRYYHMCYVEPTPIIRNKGDYPEAPTRCAKYDTGETSG